MSEELLSDVALRKFSEELTFTSGTTSGPSSTEFSGSTWVSLCCCLCLVSCVDVL